jgi:hypothetical protein
MAGKWPVAAAAKYADDDDLRKLASCCYYLQYLVGHRPFALSARRLCADLNVSRGTVAKWLRFLVDDGFLEDGDASVFHPLPGRRKAATYECPKAPRRSDRGPFHDKHYVHGRNGEADPSEWHETAVAPVGATDAEGVDC